MKRHNFTLNELLTVIAIIGVLAALLFPVLSIARERAKTTNCAGNQSNVSKILFDAMSRGQNKDKLVSASEDSGSDKKLWTTALYDRKILNSLDFARCTAFEYAGSSEVSDAEARKQAYGVVVATDGKIDFVSKKSSTTSDKKEISPNKMLIGGCAADKWGEDAKATAALDLSTNRLTAIHRGEVNIFFRDGSVATMEKEAIAANSIYYPKADSSAAEKVTESMIFGD